MLGASAAAMQRTMYLPVSFHMYTKAWTGSPACNSPREQMTGHLQASGSRALQVYHVCDDRHSCPEVFHVFEIIKDLHVIGTEIFVHLRWHGGQIHIVLVCLWCQLEQQQHSQTDHALHFIIIVAHYDSRKDLPLYCISAVAFESCNLKLRLVVKQSRCHFLQGLGHVCLVLRAGHLVSCHCSFTLAIKVP